MSNQRDRDGLEVVGFSATVPDSDGGDLVLRPLTLSDYATVREAAISWWRRQKIKVYSENADLLHPTDVAARSRFIESKLDKYGAVGYEQLPSMEVVEYENDEEAWNLPESERKVKRKVHVEYAMWWMSAEPRGMLHVLWLSATREPSQRNLSMDDVEQRFTVGGVLDTHKLEKAAQELGRISQPRIAGNGSALHGGATKEKKRRRRRTK